jgi:hypothetical protein
MLYLQQTSDIGSPAFCGQGDMEDHISATVRDVHKAHTCSIEINDEILTITTQESRHARRLQSLWGHRVYQQWHRLQPLSAEFP